MGLDAANASIPVVSWKIGAGGLSSSGQRGFWLTRSGNGAIMQPASGDFDVTASIGLNAGAVLYLSGKVKTLKEGYDMALNALDSGKALQKLQEIQKVSKELAE